MRKRNQRDKGLYPPPLTERQMQWTPSDEVPLGDEPLELPDGEMPALTAAEPSETPDTSTT